jgi:hypothetical protein
VDAKGSAQPSFGVAFPTVTLPLVAEGNATPTPRLTGRRAIFDSSFRRNLKFVLAMKINDVDCFNFPLISDVRTN